MTKSPLPGRFSHASRSYRAVFRGLFVFGGPFTAEMVGEVQLDLLSVPYISSLLSLPPLLSLPLPFADPTLWSPCILFVSPSKIWGKVLLISFLFLYSKVLQTTNYRAVEQGCLFLSLDAELSFAISASVKPIFPLRILEIFDATKADDHFPSAFDQARNLVQSRISVRSPKSPRSTFSISGQHNRGFILTISNTVAVETVGENVLREKFQ